ncbi:unnamed protein product [Closterium sp. Naga37s-1]|nr:unnamed protein product [Closterium sp. Naga37s-1]
MAVASAAAATIPSGCTLRLPTRTASIADIKVVSAPALSASEERPRGTSTLAFWLRQGNGSGKERSGGASCPSDVPREDDEYETQRLRKSKLKRKAEASTGEDEHRSIEEQQGLAQQRVEQQGLAQQRVEQQGLAQQRVREEVGCTSWEEVGLYFLGGGGVYFLGGGGVYFLGGGGVYFLGGGGVYFLGGGGVYFLGGGGVYFLGGGGVYFLGGGGVYFLGGGGVYFLGGGGVYFLGGGGVYFLGGGGVYFLGGGGVYFLGGGGVYFLGGGGVYFLGGGGVYFLGGGGVYFLGGGGVYFLGGGGVYFLGGGGVYFLGGGGVYFLGGGGVYFLGGGGVYFLGGGGVYFLGGGGVYFLGFKQGWRNERVVQTVAGTAGSAGCEGVAAGRIVLITHAECTAVQLAKHKRAWNHGQQVTLVSCHPPLACVKEEEKRRNSSGVGEGNGCEPHVAAGRPMEVWIGGGASAGGSAGEGNGCEPHVAAGRPMEGGSAGEGHESHTHLAALLGGVFVRPWEAAGGVPPMPSRVMHIPCAIVNEESFESTHTHSPQTPPSLVALSPPQAYLTCSAGFRTTNPCLASPTIAATPAPPVSPPATASVLPSTAVPSAPNFRPLPAAPPSPASDSHPAKETQPSARVRGPRDAAEQPAEPLTGVAVEEEDQKDELCAAVCGVRAVWVHPAHRRRGVATEMIKAVSTYTSTSPMCSHLAHVFSPRPCVLNFHMLSIAPVPSLPYTLPPFHIHNILFILPHPNPKPFSSHPPMPLPMPARSPRLLPLTFPSHLLDSPPSFPLSPPPLPGDHFIYASSLSPSCLTISHCLRPHPISPLFPLSLPRHPGSTTASPSAIPARSRHFASPSLTASSPTSFPPSHCLPSHPPHHSISFAYACTLSPTNSPLCFPFVNHPPFPPPLPTGPPLAALACISFAYACTLSPTQIAFSQPTESGRAFAAAPDHFSLPSPTPPSSPHYLTILLYRSVSFAYACTLSPTQIAFSQPTESGRAFAAALCHPKPFLVYK